MTVATIFQRFWKAFLDTGSYALALSQMIMLVGILTSGPYSSDPTESMVAYLGMSAVLYVLILSALVSAILIWRDSHLGWKRLNGSAVVSTMVTTLALHEWDLSNAIIPLWFGILGVLISIGTLRWVITGFKVAMNDSILPR